MSANDDDRVRMDIVVAVLAVVRPEYQGPSVADREHAIKCAQAWVAAGIPAGHLRAARQLIAA